MDVRTFFSSLVIGSIVTLLVGFAITFAAPAMLVQDMVSISAGIGIICVLVIARFRRR